VILAKPALSTPDLVQVLLLTLFLLLYPLKYQKLSLESAVTHVLKPEMVGEQLYGNGSMLFRQALSSVKWMLILVTTPV